MHCCQFIAKSKFRIRHTDSKQGRQLKVLYKTGLQNVDFKDFAQRILPVCQMMGIFGEVVL